MKLYVVTTFIGVFGLDERDKIISYRPFTKEPGKIAEKLKQSEVEMIDEEKQVMSDVRKRGYKQFVFGNRKAGVKHIEQNNSAEHFIKENLRKLAIDKNFVKDQVEFNQLLTKINLEMTKVKIKRAVERDALIVQANNTIEELDKSINIFIERLREWYGLHFPEMDRAIESHEKFARLIEKFGSREKIEDPELGRFVEKSMGSDLKEDDIKAIQLFASKILELYKLRNDLSEYLKILLKEIVPNFTELAGPQIAAKLISKAGGIGRLAKSSSSYIQLIGAEKALFRFLHGKGQSPRFGLLYNHPLIQKAPEHLKGRVARALASKLSIAVKMDYYSKEYKGDKLKKELEERVKEILSSKE